MIVIVASLRINKKKVSNSLGCQIFLSYLYCKGLVPPAKVNVMIAVLETREELRACKVIMIIHIIITTTRESIWYAKVKE